MVERVNKLLRILRRHEPDVNLLSAHLDGRLDAREMARLEPHLASCEACRADLAGLRAARDALRALPEAAPPRSFRLRPADVERAAVSGAPGPSPMLRWAPAASAVAAVVFAIVLSVDLTSSGGGSSYRAPLAARPADNAPNAQTSGAADKSIAGASAPVPQSGAAGADATGNAAAPGSPTSDTSDSQQGSPAPDATQAARSAFGPAPTATSQLQAAAGRATADNGGNNTTALRVIEIVAAAIALASAAAAIIVRRRGREGP
jgi:hypothetical protein